MAYQESGESPQFISGSMDNRLWEAKIQQSKECAGLVKKEIGHAHAILGQIAVQKQRQAAALAATTAATDVDSVPIASDAQASKVPPLLGQKRSIQDSTAPDEAAAELPNPTKKRLSATNLDLQIPHELPSSHAECECFVNLRICKYFGKPRTLYFGTVMSFLPLEAETEDDEPLWHVKYDDSDHEDYTWAELRKHRNMYVKRRQLDPKQRPGKR